MIQHLELVQDSRRRLIEAELSHHGQDISMGNTQCECSHVAACSEDRCRFIQVCKSFPDLTRPQLEALNDLCLAARHSEDFFDTVNARNQWLRTVVGHEDLHPATWTKSETWSRFRASVIIHSNVLPFDLFWSMLVCGGMPSMMHFPSCMIKEALRENKALNTQLREWKSTCAGKGWKHGTQGRLEPDGDVCESKLEIQDADVTFVKVVAKGSDGIISLITWRGARFVRKEPKGLPAPQFDAELEVVKRISHPHIIYSFGAHNCDGPQISSAYFMEYMTNDLFNFIVYRVHHGSVGDNQPPFSHHESVDVLLQIAKAMRYMHHETLNVVHCDLKSLNILLSEIATSENASHYLVKVADFGSARLADSSSGFIPGAATTNYAAPEVLRRRSDDTVCIDSPHKIDVFSFGIVAFEVLTGKNNGTGLYKRSPSRFKKGVIDGTVRPPLRGECQQHKEYTQDKDLISLIEMCWHGDPLQRPSFVEICEELDRARVRISEHMLQKDGEELDIAGVLISEHMLQKDGEELDRAGVLISEHMLQKDGEELDRAGVLISEHMLQKDDPKPRRMNWVWRSFQGTRAYFRKIASSSRNSSR